MADSISAIEFLAGAPPATVPAVCVLFGDEPLLKREALERLRQAVLAGADAELSLSTIDGKTAEPRAVFDELATVSMFGDRRMVVVENADEFVSKHRKLLEDYCEQPRQSAVLVNDVDSWPSNTRLYKKLAASGLQIKCGLPAAKWEGVDEDTVSRWLSARAKNVHKVRLADGAAERLLEIVGPALGQLDQELAKLAALAGKEGAAAGQSATVTRELVDQAVAGWRSQTVWAMIEAALEGQGAEAIVQLDRLLRAGEEEIPLLAMFSGSLRRMAAATRIVEEAEGRRQRIALTEALQTAGVKPNRFVLEKTERQLRQIGRQRAAKIYAWLLEADLSLKGARSSGDQARLVLEELVVRLSRQAVGQASA